MSTGPADEHAQAVDRRRAQALDGGRARIVLVVAITVFVAQGWILANEFPVANEQLSLHAAPPSREVVVEDGHATIADLCDGTRRIVFADARPSAVLCAGRLAWPLLVTPYIGGVHYWPLQVLRPLHHGDPMAVRRAALAIGVLGLIVLFSLLERVGGPTRAAITVCVAAVLPILLVVQAYGALFEELPAFLVVAAATVIARRRDTTLPPTPRQTAIAGALVGFALFANVKAVVVTAPLVVIGLWESPVLRRTSWRAWATGMLGGAIAMAPIVIAAVADPQGRIGHEVGWRLSIAESRLNVALLGTEVFHLLVNAVDFLYYLDVGLGGDGRLWPATLAVSGVAVLYTTWSLIRALRRLPHDRTAAACGGLQVFYLLFVWLAYNQKVATNYTPIALTFAAALGCTLAAVAERASRHRRSAGLWLAGTATIALAVLVTNMYRRSDLWDAAVSLNGHAARALGAYLGDGAGAPIVVTSNNLVGLPEALTGRSAIRLDVALGRCSGRPDEDACAARVLTATIDALPGARFLVPLRTGIVDKSWERRMVPLLETAAAGAGGRVHEEASFTTRTGIPVLALMTVDRERRPAPRAQ